MNILVTGGAGFIGASLCRWLLEHTSCPILAVDQLSYAGQLSALESLKQSARFDFAKLNINERPALDDLIAAFDPDAVMHLAAESHVDRTIDEPAPCIQSNIVGTYNLLDACLRWWRQQPPARQSRFRFLHVSTDEVYGDLGLEAEPVSESAPYLPNSPYAASKACSDHLVRAWHRTYGLPVIITHSTNNYGPGQYPEKLIPLMIIRGLSGETLPVYGSGEQVRDWVYVDDHVGALHQILLHGKVGDTYNIGGGCEQRNIDVVKRLCGLLDDCIGSPPGNHRSSHLELIRFVQDRPGHDVRYALDCRKITRELGWQPQTDFSSGLQQTVQWYLDQRAWWGEILRRNQAVARQGLRHARQSS